MNSLHLSGASRMAPASLHRPAVHLAVAPVHLAAHARRTSVQTSAVEMSSEYTTAEPARELPYDNGDVEVAEPRQVDAPRDSLMLKSALTFLKDELPRIFQTGVRTHHCICPGHCIPVLEPSDEQRAG